MMDRSPSGCKCHSKRTEMSAAISSTSAMSEILLIRHGETDWNRVRRLQGHIDIDLNDAGRAQAQALAQALHQEKPDVIIASDLQRAFVTAKAVADLHNMDVHKTNTLRERCYGAFEGLMYDEISQHYPEAYKQWRSHDPDTRFPAGEREGETMREFYVRAVKAVTTLAEQHRGRKLLLVTHGGVLDCLYRYVHDISLWSERPCEIANAAINRLCWKDQTMSIMQWADKSHLSSALDEIDR